MTTDFGIDTITESECKKLHYNPEMEPSKFHKQFVDIKTSILTRKRL